MNNYWATSVTSGTGSWTVALNYSDTSCTGPWTTFGSASQITQASNPAIAYGTGYHQFIQVAITGNVVITLVGQNQLPLTSTAGTVTFPITVTQGGTGAGTFTANGFLFGNGTSAFGVTGAGSPYMVAQVGATGVPNVGPLHLDQSAAILGVLGVPNGGCGAGTFTTNGMLYGNGTSPCGATAAGSQYQVFQVGFAGTPTVGALNLGQSAAITGTLPGASYAAVNLAAGNVNGGVTGVLPLANMTNPTFDLIGAGSNLHHLTMGAGSTFDTAVTAVVNFSNSGHTFPVGVSTTALLPATCGQGEVAFAIDASAGQNLYLCTATNTWTQLKTTPSFSAITSGTNTNHLTIGSTGILDASGSAVINFGTAAHSTPGLVALAATITAQSCGVGEGAFASDATAGRNWYFCTATNTWTQMNGGTSAFSGITTGTNTTATMTVGSGSTMNAASGGVLDFHLGLTSPAQAGVAASIPTACGTGQQYFATDATAGKNLYFCTTPGSTGVWTQMVTSGSGAAFSAITTGTNNTSVTMTVGSTSSLTFSGTGIVNANTIGGSPVPASASVLKTNASAQAVAAGYGDVVALWVGGGCGTVTNVMAANGTCVTPSGSPGGVYQSLQFNNGSGGFGGDSNIKWDTGGRLLTIVPSGSNAGITMSGASFTVNIGQNYINSLAGGTPGLTVFALAESAGNYGLLRLSNGTGSGGLDGNGAQIYCTASNGNCAVEGNVQSYAVGSATAFASNGGAWQVNGNGNQIGNNLALTGTVTAYNNIATLGQGVAPIYWTLLGSQGGTISETILINGSNPAAGTYRVCADGKNIGGGIGNAYYLHYVTYTDLTSTSTTAYLFAVLANTPVAPVGGTIIVPQAQAVGGCQIITTNGSSITYHSELVGSGQTARLEATLERVF
jgi:hypothetical protein